MFWLRVILSNWTRSRYVFVITNTDCNFRHVFLFVGGLALRVGAHQWYIRTYTTYTSAKWATRSQKAINFVDTRGFWEPFSKFNPWSGEGVKRWPLHCCPKRGENLYISLESRQSKIQHNVNKQRPWPDSITIICIINYISRRFKIALYLFEKHICIILKLLPSHDLYCSYKDSFQWLFSIVFLRTFIQLHFKYNYLILKSHTYIHTYIILYNVSNLLKFDEYWKTYNMYFL